MNVACMCIHAALLSCFVHSAAWMKERCSGGETRMRGTSQKHHSKLHRWYRYTEKYHDIRPQTEPGTSESTGLSYCHVMMNLFRSDRFMPINKRGYRETFSIKNFHWNWYHTTCTSILAMSWYWCLQYSYSILLWKCYYCQLKLKLLIIVFVT